MITYEELISRDLPESLIDYILTHALTDSEFKVYNYYNSDKDISLSKVAENNDVSKQWYHKIKKRLYFAGLISKEQIKERQSSIKQAKNWDKIEVDEVKLGVSGLKKRIVNTYYKWKRMEV